MAPCASRLREAHLRDGYILDMAKENSILHSFLSSCVYAVVHLLKTMNCSPHAAERREPSSVGLVILLGLATKLSDQVPLLLSSDMQRCGIFL
jgi:hypothetical protein